MTTPRIEILHVRDPDTDCSVEVWIDGVKIDNAYVEDIDPGRGYDSETWEENVEEARNDDRTTPAFKAAVLDAYGASETIQQKWAL